jgi:hypothetical protein
MTKRAIRDVAVRIAAGIAAALLMNLDRLPISFQSLLGDLDSSLSDNCHRIAVGLS